MNLINCDNGKQSIRMNIEKLLYINEVKTNKLQKEKIHIQYSLLND